MDRQKRQRAILGDFDVCDGDQGCQPGQGAERAGNEDGSAGAVSYFRFHHGQCDHDRGGVRAVDFGVVDYLITL